MSKERGFGKTAQVIRLIAILLCFRTLLTAQVLPLAIVDEAPSSLVAGVEFHILLHARGGVPPYVWSVASGALPEGITLSPEGLLTGRPAKPGAFALTLKVVDSGHPAPHHQQSVPGRGHRFSVDRMASTSKGPRRPDRRHRPGLQWFQRSLRSDHYHRGCRRKWAGDGNRLPAFAAKSGHYRLSNSLWQHAPLWRLRDPCRCHCRNPRPERYPSPATPDPRPLQVVQGP